MNVITNQHVLMCHVVLIAFESIQVLKISIRAADSDGMMYTISSSINPCNEIIDDETVLLCSIHSM